MSYLLRNQPSKGMASCRCQPGPWALLYFLPFQPKWHGSNKNLCFCSHRLKMNRNQQITRNLETSSNSEPSDLQQEAKHEFTSSHKPAFPSQHPAILFSSDLAAPKFPAHEAHNLGAKPSHRTQLHAFAFGRGGGAEGCVLKKPNHLP